MGENDEFSKIYEQLNDEEKKWVDRMKSEEYGQAHLLPLSKDDQKNGLCTLDNVQKIIKEMQFFDRTYPGGVVAYIQRSRKLLKDAKDLVNPFDGYTVDVPLGKKLYVNTKEFNKMEKIGIDNLQYCVFTLVAGGLGERLGYPGIKVSMPVEICTETKYIHLYAMYILAYEKYITDNDKWGDIKGDKFLPLVIMTSDDTHNSTIKLLEENDYFGLEKEQVVTLKQEKVPALKDNDAHFATKKDDRFSLEARPHGHGDVHTLLNQNGLPAKWLSEGRRWMMIFQDTNSLVFRAFPSVLGVSNEFKFDMNTVAIPRKPGEAVGAICKLSKSDGTSLTLNVEYNVLEPLLKATTGSGDVAIKDESSGNLQSKYPGNSNVLVFALQSYHDTLVKTNGAVPEFVNPKYQGSDRNAFKSPTRLECMMQDLPRLFDQSHKVGVTELERWFCFSTVKNNSADAAAKAKQNVAPECAFSGESDQYYNNGRLLEYICKEENEKEKKNVCEIDEQEMQTYLGIKYPLGPKIALLPSFAFALTDMKKKIHSGSLKISTRSVLIIEGDVELKGLDLDGTLILRPKPGDKLVVEGWVVKNKGWEFVPLDSSESSPPPYLAVRGYKVHKIETAINSPKAIQEE